MNKTIKRIAQKKTGKTWVDTYIDNDATSVYKSLSHDLIAKKLNACTDLYRAFIPGDTIETFTNRIIEHYEI